MKKVLFLVSLAILLAGCCKQEQTIPVSGVSIDKESTALTEGETVQLKATVSPTNATDKDVSWSSSDKSTATVSSTGLVTAIKEGTAVITATAESKKAQCTITVNPKFIKVTSVTLNKASATLKAAETVTLEATVNPSNATDKTVTWTSSDTAVATVKDGTVTAVAVGKATITAKAGDVSAECTITVEATEVTSVELDKKEVSLYVKGSIALVATVLPENATDKTVTWETSDAKVATVADGTVTAVAIGTATITAKAGKKTCECKVTVIPTPVESIELDKTEVTLKVGQTETLTATVKPDDATEKAVTWSSSDSAVATVENGVITAVKIGNAVITAKAGDKSATCEVTVEATPVESVTLNKTSVTLKVGQTETLTATVKPDDATEKDVTWSSSDEGIATVNKGVITAKKIGVATVTATCGDKNATCEVIVESTPVESISLNKTSITLGIGASETLTAKVKPDDASDKTVTWSSSNSSIASVSNKGVVKGLKAGEATITAKAGNKTATCKVTVQQLNVESVTLNKTSLSLIVGGTEKLTYTVSPSTAQYSSVTWSSSDTKVATVNNGTVTAVGAGNATVTLTISGVSATCSVSVTLPIPQVVDLGLSVDWASWNVGATVPEGYGTFFAWGETETKSDFSSATYSMIKDYYALKYGSDGKRVLEPGDDVATVKWGSNFRMPTIEEFTELKDNCTWVSTSINGINGYKIYGTKAGYTDKWIFLPVTGSGLGTDEPIRGGGYYWSSTLHEGNQYLYAKELYFYTSTSGQIYTSITDRSWGQTVRPVCPKK